MNKPTPQRFDALSRETSVNFRLLTQADSTHRRGSLAYAAADERPDGFVHMSPEELDTVIHKVKDPALKHSLQFGIGIHHAGLPVEDRAMCEELFSQCKIQVLVCTSTLAWGVNLPAHLVVIKGTEFYDGKSRRYVDFPITDVLQMMGRAGRPQFDKSGCCVIMVHEPKKAFYKKFLYEPFQWRVRWRIIFRITSTPRLWRVPSFQTRRGGLPHVDVFLQKIGAESELLRPWSVEHTNSTLSCRGWWRTHFCLWRTRAA